MKLESRLLTDQVQFDQDTTTHMVVSLTAPSIETDTIRPKLAIILCVDVSGSMAGNKLEYAKQSANKVIEHLKADDILGLVAFDTNVKVVYSPVRVSGKKDELRKAVSSLQAGSSTNFAGGMIKSLELLKSLDVGSNYIHRVIMLTDGAANVGPATTKEGILKLLNANREYITCSAFGYGGAVFSDFDPGLMADFAKSGNGNYAHIENPDKALAAFGTELGGLCSTYATELVVDLKAINGHTIESVVSDVDVDEDVTGEFSIKIPDILAEETRHIVVAVKLAKQKVQGPRSVNIFDVKASYQTFDAQGKKENHEEETKCKVRFAKESGKPNPELDNIVGLAQLVRAQLEAEELVKKGNFAGASSVLTTQSLNFDSRGMGGLASASQNIGAMYSNSAKYGSSTGFLRSFSAGASRGVGVAGYSDGVEHELARLGVQTSTSSTASMSTAFQAAPVQPSTFQVPDPIQIPPAVGTVVPNFSLQGIASHQPYQPNDPSLVTTTTVGSAGTSASWVSDRLVANPQVPGYLAPVDSTSTSTPVEESKKSKKKVKQTRKSW